MLAAHRTEDAGCDCRLLRRAIFLPALTSLSVAIGWGRTGKRVGSGVALFIPFIDCAGNRPSREPGYPLS